MTYENRDVLLRQANLSGWWEVEILDNDPELIKVLKEDIGDIYFKWDKNLRLWYLNSERLDVFQSIVNDLDYQIVVEEELEKDHDFYLDEYDENEIYIDDEE